MRDTTMATSIAIETTTNTTSSSKGASVSVVVPPPPGLSPSSPTKLSLSHEQQQRLLAFRNNGMTNNNNNGAASLGGLGGAFSTHGQAGGNNGGSSNNGLYTHRRAASTDNSDILSYSNRSRDSSIASHHHQMYYNNLANSNNHLNNSNNNSNPSPFLSDIFRSPNNEEVKQSRNESSQHRLNSHRMDPMLQDSHHEEEGRQPREGRDGRDSRTSSSLVHSTSLPIAATTTTTNDTNGDIFRKAYSPIIGTPKRAAGLTSPNWASDGKDDNAAGEGGGGLAVPWISYMRPSLSCPTSVFESPLFPSSSFNGGQNGGRSSGDYGGHGGLHSLGDGRNSLSSLLDRGLDSLGGSTMVLSQPYRLEKIISASAEPSPGEEDSLAEMEHHRLLGELDHDDESGLEDDLLESGERMRLEDAERMGLENAERMGLEQSLEDGQGLTDVDVSVIEPEDDDSPFRVDHNSCERTEVTSRGNAMRNLSDAFELLVVDNNGEEGRNNTGQSNGEGMLEGGSQLDKLACECANDVSEGDGSSTKPSPTSVLGFESDTAASSSSSDHANLDHSSDHTNNSTLRLENGLAIHPISMPHFYLHDSLAGNLCQGLIDRVSFYSVVRDINKEAMDAAKGDPRGERYNEERVHGKSSADGGGTGAKGNVQKSAEAVTAGGAGAQAALPPPLPNTTSHKHQVVAEDGKVHVHPDPKEERRSVLVLACVEDEDEERNPNEPRDEGGKNPNEATESGGAPVGEGSSGNTSNSNNKASPPFLALGPALLDEEWWLISAIASRTPQEVANNQSTSLLPTFYEAMGEKDASASGGAEGNASSSRTQLWKPGRSWWEAKSGKNPWVEPVVHNNRWRYLWPLIHYHKFIAKCIKKLKRNGIDVKSSPTTVSLFLRQEVCNVSDHLAFMSKYDSEEWTSALSHFDGWTDHDPTVEGAVRNLVASQRLAGMGEQGDDVRSSLLRSQIDDQILRAMQAAKEEKGRDQYEYKDGPAREGKGEEAAAASGHGGGPSQPPQQHSYSQDNSFTRRTTAWANESHLRSAIESKKRTINDTSWSNRSDYHAHPPPYPHPDAYARQYEHPPPYGPPPPGYGGPGYGGPSHYYPPPHPHPYPGGYGPYPPHPPPAPHHHMGYPPPHADMSYNEQYGHHPPQYYNGYYHHPSDVSFHSNGSFNGDGSFHEGMVFDNGMQDPYMHPPPPAAQTPNRYPGGDLHPHHGQYPASPYWGHLNISQLPGIAASPSIHITPSKPPRGGPNRSYRKGQHQQRHHQQHPPPHGGKIDGKAKSLIMFPNQTGSPASRFVMSPQDKSNPYYTTKSTHSTSAARDSANAAPPSSTSALNQSAGTQEESFILPTIEDYSPESPGPADKAAGHTSLQSNTSNTSMDLMPPSVKKMYMGSSRRKQQREDGKLSEVSENP